MNSAEMKKEDRMTKTINIDGKTAVITTEQNPRTEKFLATVHCPSCNVHFTRKGDTVESLESQLEDVLRRHLDEVCVS